MESSFSSPQSTERSDAGPPSSNASASASASTPVRKRRRPALSCEQCRRRKIKCDRAHPCDHCIKSGVECTYAPDPKDSSLKQMVSIFSQHEVSPVPSDSHSQISRHASTDNASEPQTVQQLLEMVRELEDKISRASLLSTSPWPSHFENGASSASIKGTISKTRYYGQSHWMSCIPSFQRIVGLIIREEGDPSSNISGLMLKCKSIGREVKARNKILSPVNPQLCDYVPDRSIADKLVRSYLDSFESIYRLLHVPDFLREYESYWLNPKLANQRFVTKLLLILAIGTVFQSLEEATVLRPSALQWIYAAQALLSTPFDKYHLNIEGLQSQCLLLLARLAHDVDGDLLWLSAGFIVRTAMVMGLHIDAEAHAFQRMTPQDVQTRRKIWGTILEIVVQTSLDTGGLPLLSENDYDTQVPLNADDMEQHAEGSEDFLTTVKPQDQFTQSSIQLMLLRSLPLRREIAEYINNFRPDSATYEKTIQLSEKILKVCSSNSALLQTFAISSSGPSNFQINMTELITQQYLFALHYPYAIRAKNDHTFYYSRKVCLDTSLFFLGRTAQSQENACAPLRLWGGGFLRAIPLQSTAFVADELFNGISEPGISFSTTASMIEKRRELRQHIENYVTFTVARIKGGHTNVRPHVMMSAMIAQVDAQFSGADIDASIVTAVKASLETCYEILRAELGESPLQVEPVQVDLGLPVPDDMMILPSWLPENLDSMDWWFSSDEGVDPTAWRQPTGAFVMGS